MKDTKEVCLIILAGVLFSISGKLDASHSFYAFIFSIAGALIITINFKLK